MDYRRSDDYRKFYPKQSGKAKSSAGFSRLPGDPPPITAYFHAARREVALLLQRNSCATETIYEMAARFHLTDRERQALKGLSMALRAKSSQKTSALLPSKRTWV
jgi:hypothetical protein